jgi:hypothetical protein
MPAYSLTNSRGVIIDTINVGTTTGVTYPIEIQGQGISPYGTIYADTLYHMLENFANDTEADLAGKEVEGMNFYRTDLQLPHFYNGSKFVPYLTAGSAGTGLFSMLPTATGIDFTTPGPVDIFMAPSDGSAWLPTLLVLVPTTTTGPFTPAQFNLQIKTGVAEDILENVNLANPDAGTTAHQYNIQGTTRYATGAEIITLDIMIEDTTATDLLVDAYLFGFNNQ